MEGPKLAPPIKQDGPAPRRPLTRCTRCRTPGYDIEMAHKPCGNTDGGRSCSGWIVSTVNSGDWRKCDACSAMLSREPCVLCRGIGWLFTRNGTQH
jgi:hypothetical protein